MTSMEAPGDSGRKLLRVALDVDIGPGEGVGASSEVPEDPKKSAFVKFSEWLPEPPADPVLLRRLKRVRWEMGATAIALIAFWGGLAYAVFHMRHGGMLNPLIQILIPLTMMVWMYVRSRRAPPHLADLLDLPPVCPQFPVELSYRSTAALYGKDQGIVSLFDGWMHFQGRRTSWSLSTKELKKHRWSRRSGNSGLLASVKTSAVFHTFRWNDGKEERVVVMFPMNKIEGLGGGLRKKFEQAIEPWFNAPAVSSDTLLWPPTLAAPGLVRRRAVIRKRWICLQWATILASAVAVMECFHGGRPWWWAVAAVVSWICIEIVLAYASTSLAEVNRLSRDDEQIEFSLPARPWWTRIGLKL
jgi:hypothetical protein